MFRKQKTDSGDTPGPQPKRGLGPFTGGQLTVIIVAVVVAVLVPVGAWAVTGSNSFVTDFTSGVHAKVDAKQNVATAVHDATSGTAAKVNALGQLSTIATGSVTAGVNTGAIVHSNGSILGSEVFPNTCSTTCVLLIGPPAGKGLIVSSIHLISTVVTPGIDYVQILRNGASTCSGPGTNVVDTMLLTAQELDYPAPAGLSVPAGQSLCLRLSNPADVGDVGLTAWGYTVASTAAPS